MLVDQLSCQFHNGKRGLVFKKKKKANGKKSCKRVKNEVVTLAADHDMVI